MTAKPTLELIAALTDEGADVRFVGGPVRDALLGRESSDIDIGTPDPPQRVMALLNRAQIDIRTVPRGVEHGTVIAVHDDNRYEITTLRCDVRTDGRHANVAFTADWEADAARRDFTINAMSATPDPDNVLYDYFGGQADLKAGCVRFVGDPATRIAEDHLRILRFFRFYAWYGTGEPDPAALAACNAATRRISTVSGERVRDEMMKLLLAPNPVSAVVSMRDAGVLDRALPKAQDIERFVRLVAIERNMAEPAKPIRRLASLIPRGDEALSAVDAVTEHLRLSGGEQARLIELVSSLSDVITPDLDRRSQRIHLYQLSEERFRNLVLLTWASDVRGERDNIYRAMLRAADEWEVPTFPLRGEDVLARGIASGPEVGRLLQAVEARWIARDFAPGRAALLEELDALVAESSRE